MVCLTKTVIKLRAAECEQTNRQTNNWSQANTSQNLAKLNYLLIFCCKGHHHL